MKLYSNSFAPSPRRVRMFAAERGAPLEIVEVDLTAGANRSPDYLALNPAGEVPTLVLDDGTVLAESMAIIRWLDATTPGPSLLGTTPLERARVDEFVERLMYRLYLPTAHVFRNTHKYWIGRITQVPEWGEFSRGAVLAERAALEALLADGREFLVGGGFTLADVVAFTALEFGKPSGLRVDATQPALQAYLARIGARPSAKA